MNIVLFNSDSILYQDSMVEVTDNVITDSIDWINGYESGGGTNIYQAVIDAINLLKSDIDKDNPFEYINQIILITDGKPTAGITDSDEIQNGILDANDELSPALSAIFCLGIGDDYGTNWVDDLNYPLLRSIATQNDGFDARIKESETETILSEYYDILQSPVLAFIELDYGDYIYSLTRNEYRGLYSGTDIVVCGKIMDELINEITISLTAYRESTDISIIRTIEFDENEGVEDVVDRIWA